jgi:sigma-E factor negative regulatory protein RseA
MVMEKISALMDGELDAHEGRGQIARLKEDPALAGTWNTFHLIGDAMRGERPLSAGFNERLAARIASEPTVLAPQRSANPSRRPFTYALSAAASISAVALVGWVAFANYPLTPGAQQIAQAPVVVPSPSPAAPLAQPPSVSSEGRMNEYLMAHQEYSPSTAIQGLAPYIRSVSTTQVAQGR